MNPNEASAQFIKTRIRNEGFLGGVWRGMAPEGASYPLIVIRWLGGGDDHYVNDRRGPTRSIWLVYGTIQGNDTDALIPIDEAIDRAVQDAPAYSPLPGDYVLLDSIREAPFENATIENNTPYRQLGGRYRLEVAKV